MQIRFVKVLRKVIVPEKPKSGNTQGGKRAGAGRPPTTVVHDNAIVGRKIKASAQEGWEVLADSYPAIVRSAVNVALGDGENSKPNIPMLRTLLELMIKVTGTEADHNESAATQLAQRFLDRLTANRNEDQTIVERDGDGHHITVESRNADRSTVDPAVPRVARGDSISFP